MSKGRSWLGMLMRQRWRAGMRWVVWACVVVYWISSGVVNGSDRPVSSWQAVVAAAICLSAFAVGYTYLGRRRPVGMGLRPAERSAMNLLGMADAEHPPWFAASDLWLKLVAISFAIACLFIVAAQWKYGDTNVAMQFYPVTGSLLLLYVDRRRRRDRLRRTIIAQSNDFLGKDLALARDSLLAQVDSAQRQLTDIKLAIESASSEHAMAAALDRLAKANNELVAESRRLLPGGRDLLMFAGGVFAAVATHYVGLT